jgi:hypothetical protein
MERFGPYESAVAVAPGAGVPVELDDLRDDVAAIVIRNMEKR